MNNGRNTPDPSDKLNLKSLNTTSVNPACIAYISDDPLQAEKVRFYLDRHTKTSLYLFDSTDIDDKQKASQLLSQLPEVPDLFVSPTEDLDLLFHEYRRIALSVPIIGYGTGNKLVYAIQMGCSDYLKEPWFPEELWIRARKSLSFGRLPLPWGTLFFSQSFLRNSLSSVRLNQYEYSILKLLTAQQGNIVPREAFYYRLWGKSTDKSRALDMHISKLRKKLQLLVPEGEQVILSAHGKGYYIPSR